MLAGHHLRHHRRPTLDPRHVKHWHKPLKQLVKLAAGHHERLQIPVHVGIWPLGIVWKVGVHLEPCALQPLLLQFLRDAQRLASFSRNAVAQVPASVPHRLNLLQLQSPALHHQFVQLLGQIGEVLGGPERAYVLARVRSFWDHRLRASTQPPLDAAHHTRHPRVARHVLDHDATVLAPLLLSVQQELPQALHRCLALAGKRVVIAEHRFFVIVYVRSRQSASKHPSSP
mmetsp:Transcript_18284/g.37076  ORF Transcript_18284/g.37076 Transcript_18284/m.37076 type:complete len:229 (-) Transcript_18284:125-811(-)